MKIKHLLITISLLFTVTVNANTFVVTSNADSGPNTLRQAILDAAANGTSNLDSILFNIPDQSVAGRTIILSTELPSVSSNVIIDGTSQPGSYFGLSNTKIAITVDRYFLIFVGLYIENAMNVEIYGLFLKFYTPGLVNNSEAYGIRLKGSSNITIGKAGKGNIISGFFWGITNNYYNYYSDSTNDLTIQSNWINYDENGLKYYANPTSSSTGIIAILLQGAYNICIGGNSPNQGNCMLGRSVLEISYRNEPQTSYFLKLINNKVCTNILGTSGQGSEGGIQIYGNNTIENSVNSVKTEINDNQFGGEVSEGLYFVGIPHRVEIKRNRFGTNAAGNVAIANTYSSKPWLHFYNVNGKVLIGGDNIIDRNYFTKGYTGIAINQSYKVYISKNSFFCNGGGINIFSWYLPNKPFVTINNYTSSIISGKTNPNAIVEIGQNHTCVNPCQSVQFVTKVNADSYGNWQYINPSLGNLVVKSTTIDSATSEFARPEINILNVKVKHATCGKNNGSITGISIISGTNFQWLNNMGQVVGTDTSILNLPSGYYTFSVAIGSNVNACKITYSVEIKNIEPIQLFTPTITNASCGGNNGSIYSPSLYIQDSVKFAWFNDLGDTLQPSFSVNGLSPGTYWFKSWVNYDTTCKKVFGPYFISNQSGPFLNLNNIQITNATCNQNNGSIQNIQVVNSIGSQFFRWEDSTGTIVASSINLLNIRGGKYRLKFKDASACDTIVTAYFIIQNNGVINIDTSNKIIKPSGCNQTSGAINGLGVNGATVYEWINISSSNIVGTSINLQNISAGSYQLKCSNGFGCITQSSVFIVPNATFANINITSIQQQNANCNNNNGQIQLLQFSANSSSYTFNWIDSITGNNYTNNLPITGLSPSTYQLFARDSNNCEKKIFTTSILQLGKPVLNSASTIVKNDTCNLFKAEIIGLQVSGGSGFPYTWQWFNTNGNTIANATTNQLISIGAGSYYVVVKDISGCSVTSSIYSVNNIDQTILAPRVDDGYIFRGTSAVINVKNFQPYNYWLYDTLPLLNPIQISSNGLFNTNSIWYNKYFYLQGNKGTCKSSLTTVYIKVFDKSKIILPNAFSPNSDGINDRFGLTVEGVVNLDKFSIYNRNGNLVFTTKNILDYWDGTIDGNKAPIGTYYWLVNARDNENRPIKESGYILLIR